MIKHDFILFLLNIKIMSDQDDIKLIQSLAEHLKQTEILIRQHSNVLANIKEVRNELFQLTTQIFERLAIIENKLNIQVEPPKNSFVGIDITQKNE